MSGFLSGIIGVEDSSRSPINTANAKGEGQPIILVLDSTISWSARDREDGTTEIVISSASGGSGASALIFEGGGQPQRTPTHVHINANMSASYNEDGPERHLFINANQQALKHAPVDCVLITLPTIYSDGLGYYIPTAEQADGFTMVTGSRCLIPTGSNSGIWYHNGTRLVRTDTDITIVFGDSVFVKSGRFYKNRTMMRRTQSHIFEPDWGASGAPMYAHYSRVSSGSTVTMIPFFVDVTASTLTRLHVDAYARNETTGDPARTYSVDAVLQSNGTGATVVDGRLSFADPGETDTDARLWFTNVDGYIRIYARGFDGTNTYNYSVAVYCEQVG